MDVMQLSLKNIRPPIANRPVVLVVDDDEDNLLLIALAVEQLLNCSLITAIDGRMALKLAKTFQPDLILLDIILPEINGLEVAHRLKQNPQTRTIPIIAVTALVNGENRDLIFRAGCDDYLSKPYMLEDLEAVIHHHLLTPVLCLN